MRTPRESVVVDRKPFGCSSFSLCQAELQPDGALLVFVIETGQLMRTFQPGTWSNCRGVGVTGLDLYFIRPSDVDTLEPVGTP